MGRRLFISLWLALGFFAVPCARALQTPQDRIAGSLELFNRETDPVRKAKQLPRLGQAQLEEIQRLADAGSYVDSGKLLETYRDEVKSTFQGLQATGVNAEKKPGGFKELQIHLRKALNQIDDVIRKVPAGPREPFQLARQDIGQINRQLIELLFPRQPGKTPKDKRKG